MLGRSGNHDRLFSLGGPHLPLYALIPPSHAHLTAYFVRSFIYTHTQKCHLTGKKGHQLRQSLINVRMTHPLHPQSAPLIHQRQILKIPSILENYFLTNNLSKASQKQMICLHQVLSAGPTFSLLGRGLSPEGQSGADRS